MTENLKNLLRSSVQGAPWPEELRPTEEEWKAVFRDVKRQTLFGVTYPVIENLESEVFPSRKLYCTWALAGEKVAAFSALAGRRAEELTRRLGAAGFRTCVLKGAGTAQYYPRPELRQSGDIDIWVDAPAQEVLRYLGAAGVQTSEVCYHHCGARFFPDVNVEVHWRPSWMNSVVLNRRLQRYFRREAPANCRPAPEEGFNAPGVEFAAVYCVVHIFRHLFFEGIGLRQFMDLHFILEALPESGRPQVLRQLEELGLGKFTAAAMWVLCEVFGTSEGSLLCSPDPVRGGRLLREIEQGGNFGHYSSGPKVRAEDGKMRRARVRLGRLLRFAADYPREFLAAPFFKAWQYLWRAVVAKERNNC